MVEMMRIGHGIDDACTVAAAVVSEIAVVDNADGPSKSQSGQTVKSAAALPGVFSLQADVSLVSHTIRPLLAPNAPLHPGGGPCPYSSSIEQCPTTDSTAIMQFLSQRTSFTSLDFEDDVIRYFGSTESPEYIPELAEDFRQRDDVLASPLMFPKQWSTLDDDYDVADSDDSYNRFDGQLGGLCRTSKQSQKDSKTTDRTHANKNDESPGLEITHTFLPCSIQIENASGIAASSSSSCHPHTFRKIYGGYWFVRIGLSAHLFIRMTPLHWRESTSLYTRENGVRSSEQLDMRISMFPCMDKTLQGFKTPFYASDATVFHGF
ncbi:hypothetical protein RRG08_004885 [Elysia crispata]|uniref:Uncharacterized protein n=1 Tax=Elysia crispata TaxID=231223 RepID=A0AAE1DHH2_9GAST|nr:hypothetical protein RRG08_004885 [Elysia crispata]